MLEDAETFGACWLQPQLTFERLFQCKGLYTDQLQPKAGLQIRDSSVYWLDTGVGQCGRGFLISVYLQIKWSLLIPVMPLNVALITCSFLHVAAALKTPPLKKITFLTLLTLSCLKSAVRISALVVDSTNDRPWVSYVEKLRNQSTGRARAQVCRSSIVFHTEDFLTPLTQWNIDSVVSQNFHLGASLQLATFDHSWHLSGSFKRKGPTITCRPAAAAWRPANML